MHFVSAACEGQTCRICGKPATHKLGEEIPHDEPCSTCGDDWKLVEPSEDGDHLSRREAAEHETCADLYHRSLGAPRHNLTALVCCTCFRMVVGASAPCEDPEAPPYPDGFVCGRGLDDPENASWTHEVYATREEAINAGERDLTARAGIETYETARISCLKTRMPNPLSAEGACNDAEDSDFGEAMLENWQDKVFGQDGKLIEELQDTLDQVWGAFEEKHKLWVWGIWFSDVQAHSLDEVRPEEPVA